MTEFENRDDMKGLSSSQVKKLLEKYGFNELIPQKKESFFHKILDVLSEPMFLLLIVAAVIYFILGEPRDGAIMLVFVIGIISIEVIQEWKTDKTLNALKDLSAPHIKVIRDGQEKTINSKELVPGDIMLIAEGIKIPADGKVLTCNDLCIDESSLTGEAEGVWKIREDMRNDNDDYWKKDCCYAGTLVIQGNAVIRVDKTGAQTEYGKIGTSVAFAPDTPTPLQKQTAKLVKVSAGIAALLFALVSGITYMNIPDHVFKDRIIESILSGITLAMAMIPEELPVILTVFLSMGAWRLAKKNSLIRRLPAVETLGSVSVLCVDKTGTITMNQMTVRETWSMNDDEKELCEVMRLGCEINAYDPMEKAMLHHCDKKGTADNPAEKDLIAEYPFTNQAKMMGHVWNREGKIIAAAKGSPEKILKLCSLSKQEALLVDEKMKKMTDSGLRVIAVAKMEIADAKSIPATLDECNLSLCGLIGLADPPRDSVKEDIRSCYRAGVRVVMITGDNGNTASAIAKQVGMRNCDEAITGDQLNEMTEEELREMVKKVNIFSRVVPEHKMRIVKAFKDNNEVVAMTGDGVNDAPALKYADIGIAMGKRGSEVSREAADLILLDDNFSTIVDTIKDGRRIFDNIRKAVGYVFTIHIPIAFTALLAPSLGINPLELMLLPLHVVLLELVIDPTCSIVLERQPAEKDIMERMPRSPGEKLLTFRMLCKSVVQGLMIFAASFGTYYIMLKNNSVNADIARTMGLAVIFISNLILVQVNSSDSDFAFKSLLRLSKDKVMWIVNAGTIAGLAILIYAPVNSFLKLAPLTFRQVMTVLLISFIAVAWFEIVKFVKLIKRKHIEKRA